MDNNIPFLNMLLPGPLEDRCKAVTIKHFATLNTHLNAVKNEFKNLSFFQRLISLITFWGLFPILAYFNEESVFPLEKLTSPTEELPQTEKPAVESLRNIKRYLMASIRLPLLYVVPTLPMVAFFSLQNIIANAFLKNTLSLRLWRLHYHCFADKLADPRFVRDVALDLRPFLTWFFAVPPVVMLMLAYRTAGDIKDAVEPDHNETRIKGLSCFRFRQQINKKPTTKEKEFFYSPWFTPVALAPFVLGLPAMLSYYLYWHFGLDALFGNPSASKQFVFIFPFIGLYLTSLGWALSAMFFKSYFTLGLSYTSTEYDIEVYPDVIKMLPMKGWFADFLTFRTMHSPAQIAWKDVTAVKLSGSREPIQLHLNSKNALLSTFLKIGESYEAVARKMDIHTEYLTIHTATRLIDIRLWELSAKDRVELFKSIREYAPAIYLDAPVQQALIGSSVMREPQYTEIWFSVLQNHSAPPAIGDLSAGRTLKKGAYRIEKKVAAGGQGIIYQAFDQNGKTIVLKEFVLIADESLEVMIESAKEFENETKIMHLLNHEKIVKLVDMFHENGRVYIALEHIEGRSLRDLVKEDGPLESERVLELGKQMCEILQYLHSLNPAVVHRDLTPENLILQNDGTLKLIDFSVAQEKSKASKSECAGKHAYTPPEQFRGEAVPQSDLYACGATMYFLATGCDPSPITKSTLPVTADDDDKLRRHLANVIESATILDVAERCPSAQWLYAEIASRLQSSPVIP